MADVTSRTRPTRVLLVQYAGDYLAAYHRLQETGTETYFAHRYVLEQLGLIAQTLGETAIFCSHAGRWYEERLPSGLTVMGGEVDPVRPSRRLIRVLAGFDPTHLVVLGPWSGIIRWGLRTNRRVLGVFASSFEHGRMRRFLRYGRVTRLLNDSRIEWIANHGINSCLALKRLGVDADRIIPWDFPHTRHPMDIRPRSAPPPGIPRMLFVGSIIRSKGIGDAIAGLSHLRARGYHVALDVVGSGDLDTFRARARKHAVHEHVLFHGVRPNHVVFEMMQRAFAVLVPSHHAYPEGLPFTIYEALSARAPIVASDHPMFRHNLEHRKTAMIFEAGNPTSLADQIEQLLRDRSLYAALSGASQGAWERIQIETKWGELLRHWIADASTDRAWLLDRRLSADRYHAVVRDRAGG